MTGQVPGIPAVEVRQELQRILTSGTFQPCERLRSFLEFIVEGALQGRLERFKEYVLGTEVYGKGADFDPRIDSTVRVEAGRLRRKLGEYYALCRSDPVIISLPKGSYGPAFERNPAEAPQTTPLPERAPRRSPRRWWIAVAGGLIVALLVVFMNRTRPGTAAQAGILRAVPLSVRPGPEIMASLSPDGSMVAFVWAGQTDSQSRIRKVWVKTVGSETMRELTKGHNPEHAPAWSPDGTEIVFQRVPDGIFVISHLGGPERKISSSGTLPKWTPDGRSVLLCDAEGERPPGIYQVSLDTLERREVFRARQGSRLWRFDISPDGKNLAFILVEDGNVGDIYVAPMEGGEPRRVTDWNSAPNGVGWSPDGQQLIYAAGQSGNLFKVHAFASRPSRGSPVLLPVGAFDPSLSRPGPGRAPRLAFSTFRPRLNLRLIDLRALAGEAFQAVSAVADSTSVDFPGSFSRDGSKVAFTSERSGGPQLWLASRDGSGIRQLTSLEGSAHVRSPSWSPDGSAIAFDAALNGNSDIYTIEVGAQKARRLTSEVSNERLPHWSEDGRWIYFTSDRTGRMEIWRTPASGGPPTQVTRNGGAEPVEAMDGKTLFYIDRIPPDGAGWRSSSRLMQVSRDGGDESVLLEGIHHAHWTPTEQGIFYISFEREGEWTNFYSFKDRKVTKRGRLPFRVARFGNAARFTVSRDGRWALSVEQIRTESDLMLVEEFR